MLNFIKKYKYHIILILLFSFFIFISAITYSHSVFSNISDSIFRLHVIANSNSDEDQTLKLKVRDSILEYINTSTSNISTKYEFINFVSTHKDELVSIAENKIKDEGYNYKVKIEIGNFYFPTKQYNNFTLPSGNYDGLKVEIGKAEGENWWCVMFPPLCLIDNSTCKIDNNSIKILEQNLSNEEISLITDETPDIKFKFKILELFN